MEPMKMSWREEGGQLSNGWTESEASEPYNPAWMQSSYPEEASVSRSSTDQSSLSLFGLSPFGKLRLL